MMNMAGVVTGGASGIGEAVALQLLDQGATVVVADRSEEALARLRGIHQSDRLVPAVGDVTDPGFADELVRLCDDRGGVRFLVNVAGVMHPPLPLHELPLADYERVVDVNMKGSFICYRAVASAMVEAGARGAIVNVVSTAGIRPVATAGGYVGSKHGVVGLTTTAALELAPLGIRVNAVCPGVTDTPLFRANRAGGAAEAMAAMIPLRRVASAAEVAAAVLWLLSDAASYVTGAVIPVDGGLGLV